MWLVSKYSLNTNFNLNGINILALVFLIIAIIMIVLSINKFKKNRTTISPLRPNKTSSLITSGIYNYTRNPMYLGLLLILISTALFIKNFINKNQILPEEQILENIFGEEYRNYTKKVKRWI